MRILFLSELFYPHGGGAEYATHLISQVLSEAGHEVRVITNRFKDESEDDAINRVQIHRKYLIVSEKSVKYSLLLKFGILKEKLIRENLEWADIIYLPRYWYNIIPEIKKIGKPVIVHLHDYIAVCPVANLFNVTNSSTCTRKSCNYSCIYSFERLRGKSIPFSALSSIVNSSFGWYMGRMIRKSDAILCVSNTHRDLVASKAPDLNEKITVMPNPLPDLAYLEIESKGLAYFGGSSPLKGYSTLTQSLKHVKDPETRFDFTGFKKPTEIKEKDPRVAYHGWITGAELENVYRKVHAVVVPSIIAEPAPYVIYEAILRGRIIVASDIGGIPEQVEGYEGCFLFRAGDTRELAEKIRQANSVELNEAREIGCRNRERLIRKEQNKQMREVFEEVARRVSMKN